MKSHNTSMWTQLNFPAVVMRHIIEKPVEGETPSGRLKQVGMMSVIYYLQMDGQETTVNNIIRYSGVSRSAFFEIIPPLLARNLLREERILNAAGRGRASKFFIPDEFFESLALIQSKR